MHLFKRICLFSFLLSPSALSAADTSAKPASEPITIAAAASLQDALDEIQKQSPQTAKITYGASGALKQQIIQGAPIDLFLSAADKPVSELAKQGLTSETRPFLANKLLLIARKNSAIQSLTDLKKPELKRLALGEPRSVPAGDYTMQFLDSHKLSADLAPKFIYAKDVRQVLTYVQRGEVDAGFVYQSDLYGVTDVERIATAPEGSHKPIHYVAAVIKNSKHAQEAKTFLDHISSEKSQLIWKKYGFDILSAKTHGAH